MPRPKKPARLWKRYDTKGDKESGNQDFQWTILDAGKQISTGHRGAGGTSGAEEALARHIANKHAFPQTPQRLEEIDVGTVLIYYIDRIPEEMAAPERQLYAIKALSPFWGSKPCSDVHEDNCRTYAKTRTSNSTARRELGTLRAALNKAAGRIIQVAPPVWLPPKGKARPEWLTRKEVAALIFTLWRNKKTKHAARLVLAMYYTGSRPRTIAKTTWHPRADGPWLDLENRVWYRSGADETETVKSRREHQIPKRLLAHLRRWKRIYGGTFIVEHIRCPGKPVMDIGKSLETACKLAGIQRITPHAMKHTAITAAVQDGWLMQDVVDYFSTSQKTIEDTYWHMSPHFQGAAASAAGSLGRSATIRNETT
jgi:integrase